MQQVDAREELGQLVRAFRLYLERQARAGAYAVSGAPMPAVALPDDGEDGEPGPDDWQEGAPEGWPGALAETAQDSTSQARPPARHAGPDFDGPVPSFEAALMAVLDEPAPRRAPRAAHEQARPSPQQGMPQDAPPRSRATLADVRDDLGDCQRCKLAGQRTNIVFGVGAPDAALMFIGEAPGADEDRLGEPFVGAAGKLLDLMIEAMGWTRDTVYIANVLKCRPPGNRDPQPDEVAACQPFLARQIDAVAPRVIVTLGKPATQLILQTSAPISALRGRFQEYRGIRVMPTFHPAFLLRTPERKRDTWSDLKLVIAELDRLGVPSPRPPKT
jgi:DNA polymerase